MNVIINSLNISGDVPIPPSKSLSHRAIIAASLSENMTSTVENLIFSKDILATIDSCRAFGAKIDIYEDKVLITGSKVKRINNVVNSNESGSTVRFMIPILLTIGESVTFTGENNLVNRPLDPYLDIFDKKGISYKKGDAYLPLTVYDSLKAGNYSLKGDVSSQFITGLLYALPLLDGSSTIEITTPLMSKGYVDLTLDVLNKYGIIIKNNNYKSFYIEGNQKYCAADYRVEGDYSQSAFFLLAASFGADIKLIGMNENSLQGDKKIISDLNKFGGNVSFLNGTLVAEKSFFHDSLIDMSQTPDLGPALSVFASLVPGKTTLFNAERLRIKECDRITSMVTELNKLGANASETKDSISFLGVKQFKSGTVSGHNDHRVVMALTMARLKSNGPIKILGAEAVNKSFPHFFKLLESLGADITYE